MFSKGLPLRVMRWTKFNYLMTAVLVLEFTRTSGHIRTKQVPKAIPTLRTGWSQSSKMLKWGSLLHNTGNSEVSQPASQTQTEGEGEKAHNLRLRPKTLLGWQVREVALLLLSPMRSLAVCSPLLLVRNKLEKATRQAPREPGWHPHFLTQIVISKDLWEESSGCYVLELAWCRGSTYTEIESRQPHAKAAGRPRRLYPEP